MGSDVLIWTEGGTNIGMGHVARCLAIARALEGKDVMASFYINDDEAVKSRLALEGFGFEVRPMDSVHEAAPSERLVLIDSKKDISNTLVWLKSGGKKLVVMDNISDDVRALADAVIVPSPHLIPMAGGNVMSGAGYISIAHGFTGRRAAKRREYGLPLNVLVTMGGADPNLLTEKVLNALRDMEGIVVTVTIGPAFGPRPALEAMEEAGDDRFSFVRGASDLSGLMNRAHVAFTALGTTIYELAYMAVPSIVIANFREDEKDLKEFEETGIGLALGHHEDVGPEDIRGAARRFLSDRETWEGMSRRGPCLVDGMGASRIADIITGLMEDGCTTANA